MKFTVKSIALSGVALGMFVTVAHASDSDASSNWTGFSLGVGGGGSFNFSNMDAGGFGAFQVEDPDNGDDWMDGGFLFGSGGSSNYGYTETEYYNSGGSTTMWTGAGMGNVGSLVAEVAQALADYDVNVSGSNSGRDLDNEAGMAGFLGTVRGGFDVQLDRLVVGLDAGFNFGKTEINNASEGVAGASYELNDWVDSSGFGTGEAYLNSSLELGNSWFVGGRAGFLATDSTLIFGSAGYVSTHAKLSAAFTGQNDAGGQGDWSGFSSSGYADAQYDISTSDSDWLDGYYFGGGMEQMLTSSVSMKLEYRLSDLGSISTSDVDSREVGNPGANDGATWIAAVGAHAEPTVHTVTATVNWRF
jgi:outer membrane immunogenic protein